MDQADNIIFESDEVAKILNSTTGLEASESELEIQDKEEHLAFPSLSENEICQLSQGVDNNVNLGTLNVNVNAENMHSKEEILVQETKLKSDKNRDANEDKEVGTGGERYSNSEKIRMIELMAESANTTQVQRKFKREFGKKPPSTKTIRALVKRFRETGSVGRKPYSQRFRPKSNEEAISRVTDFFRKNPDMSTRQGAKELKLSRSTVGKIIQGV
jgi:transposase